MLTYHRKKNFITSSTRTFEKPENSDDKQWNVSFREGLHNAFISSNGNDITFNPVERQLPVYQELVRGLKAEAKGIKAVRDTQHAISQMLELRMQEKFKPVLLTSVHDTIRNEAAKQRREDLRILAEIEERFFLALSQEIFQVFTDCIQETKRTRVGLSGTIFGTNRRTQNTHTNPS